MLQIFHHLQSQEQQITVQKSQKSVDIMSNLTPLYFVAFIKTLSDNPARTSCIQQEFTRIQGLSNLATQIGSYWPQMGHILDFLRSVSVHFDWPSIPTIVDFSKLRLPLSKDLGNHDAVSGLQSLLSRDVANDALSRVSRLFLFLSWSRHICGRTMPASSYP